MNPAEREFEVVRRIRIDDKAYDVGDRVRCGGKVAAWFLEQGAIRVPLTDGSARRAATVPNSSVRPRVGGCGGCGWR